MTQTPTETIVVLSHTPAKKKRRGRRRKSTSDTASTSSDEHCNGSSSSTASPNPRCRKRTQTTKRQINDPDLSEEQKSRYVAMDCEMVGVGYSGHRSVLARVCIINWNGKKLMDAFVKPQEQVTDYRTFVSGITPDRLESEWALDMSECRARVSALLKGKILVGHALKNDLHCLGLDHPWYDLRDTAKYEPFMKIRFDDGILWPRKLKELAKEKLGRDVQMAGVSHSPFEDSKTALDLYKLVRRKWEKAMDYKINRTKEIQQEQLLQHEADVQLALQ